MISLPGFPLWRYLNQSLFDASRPLVLDPHRYWQLHAVWHLERCLNNNWVERCWQVDYYQFQKQYQSFVERRYFEEGNLAFVKHCWHIKPRRYGLYCHPEEFVDRANYYG